MKKVEKGIITKLITFTTSGFSRIGAIVDGEKVVDLNYAHQAQLHSEGQ